jgi:hypothetical protein
VVFLAITPDGLNDALRVAADSGSPIWCGADAIPEQAYLALKAKDLSRFIYDLGDRDPLALEGALNTIALHHPNEVIWVEVATAPN